MTSALEAEGLTKRYGRRTADRGYRQQIRYIAADRFWALQAVETAIFLGLALGTFWWVRNRVT